MKRYKKWLLVLLLIPIGISLYAFVQSPPANSNTDRIAFIRKSSVRGVVPYIGFFDRGIYIINIDGSGVTHLGKTASVLTWSPSGDQIAFYNYDRKSLYIVRVDNSTQERLLQENIFVSTLSWAPDNRNIAYSDGTGMIHILDIETREVNQLFDKSFQGVAHPSWSPDGQRIAFVLNAFSYNEPLSSIATVHIDRSNLIQLTPNDGSQSPEWSPKGEQIVFVREGDIYLIDSDGTNVKQLTYDGKNGSPTWAPDGDRIAFLSSGGENVECDMSGYFDNTGFCTTQLRMINTDGTNLVIIRDEAELILSPVWAPNN